MRKLRNFKAFRFVYALSQASIKGGWGRPFQTSTGPHKRLHRSSQRPICLWRLDLGRVFELGVPACPAVREQAEEMPGAAVQVAGAKVVFGYAGDAAVAIFAED